MEMTSQRLDFMTHLLLLSCLVFFWQDRVQAESNTIHQKITSNCTCTADVFIGDPATITCYFSMDLKEHSKPFTIYRYSINNTEETLLKCFWPSFGQVKCDRKADSYVFDNKVSDQLSVTIPRTSLDNIGRFTCNAEPSYPTDIKECFLILKQRPTTVPIPVTSAGQRNGAELPEEIEKNNNSTVTIIVGVLVPVGIVTALIFILFCRKRVLRLLPCSEWRTDKEKGLLDSDAPLIETSQPLLQPATNEKENGQPGVPDDRITIENVGENEQQTNEECDHSGYRGDSRPIHDNLSSSTGTGFTDSHRDTPASEGTEDETRSISQQGIHGEKLMLTTQPVTKATELIACAKAKETAPSSKAADETNQKCAPRTGKEMIQTAAATYAEITQFAPATKAGEMMQPALVTETETAADVSGLRIGNEEQPMNDEAGNTASELKKAAIDVQDVATTTTANNNNLSFEIVSSKTDTECAALGALPFSQEKELDIWREAVEEAENQRKASTERQINLNGCVSSKGTQREEEYSMIPEDRFPYDPRETQRYHHHPDHEDVTRRTKERKTEEKMGGQYLRVDRTEAGRYAENGREQRGMEGAGCQVISRAPTVDARPKLNVLFYQNKIPCRPDGAYIDVIHRYWSNDFETLERHHAYIQWLFPVCEEPHRNRHAQRLYDYEAKEIQQDKQAFARFITSYDMMLKFYGLQLANEGTGEIERMQYGWQRRFYNLQQNTHNYLRITRILTSLGEMGLEYYKAPFIRHILLENMHGYLLNTMDSCRRFWIETVVDDTKKQELIDLYNIAARKSVKFMGRR